MNPARAIARLSLFAVVAVAAGCSDNPSIYYRPGINDAQVAAPTNAAGTGWGDAAAAPRETTVAMPEYAANGAPVPTMGPNGLCCPSGYMLAYTAVAAPCEPAPAPCEPVPCAPPPCACYLPCQDGHSDWHARAVVGFPFMFGTDAGEGCFYWGVDVGTTRPCCLGFDAFYRRMSCDDKSSVISPGNSPTAVLATRPIAARFDRDGFGKDGGTMQWVGLKVTYQKQIHGELYGWGGVGPEYFWTNDYINNDSGLGGFAELGIAWKFASWGALRLGVDIHGDYTSVTRKAVANAGKSRLLWTVAPTIGLEIDF